MRMLGKNKRKLKYALYTGTERELTKRSGTTVVHTGEYVPNYERPVDFMANISFSGGESKEQEFGVDLSQYDATIVCAKGYIPIDETSLIFHTSEPVYDGNYLDPSSADYTVVKHLPSLNYDKYILKRVVKK